MIITLSPRVKTGEHISYTLDYQRVSASYKGVTDVFDFTDVPDGELVLIDEQGNDLIETSLEYMPFIEAKKTEGVLHIALRFHINSNEKDERLLFPKPMSLDEFNDLMEELAERDKTEENEGTEEVESDGKDGLEE